MTTLSEESVMEREEIYRITNSGKVIPNGELIRCKDCKRATDYTDQMTDCSYHCRKYGGFHSGDWYCAGGERRTDDA